MENVKGGSETLTCDSHYAVTDNQGHSVGHNSQIWACAWECNRNVRDTLLKETHGDSVALN